MEKKIDRTSLVLIFMMMPYLFLYLWAFWLTMGTALDRQTYIEIMADPFSARVEVGYKILAAGAMALTNNERLSLALIQGLSFLLLMVTVLKRFDHQKYLKVFASIFIFYSAFSVVMFVQIRFGLAMVIALFVLYGLKIRPSLKSLPVYLIPCFFHYGLIPFVVSIYAIEMLKINNWKRLITFFFASVVSFYFVFSFLPDYLGLSSYYRDYFEGDFEQRRKLSFTLIFYFLIFLFLILRRGGARVGGDYWVSIFGMIFPLMVLITDAVFFYKMMIPFVVVGFFVALENFDLKQDEYPYFAMAAYLLSFSGLFYAYHVGNAF